MVVITSVVSVIWVFALLKNTTLQIRIPACIRLRLQGLHLLGRLHVSVDVGHWLDHHVLPLVAGHVSKLAALQIY